MTKRIKERIIPIGLLINSFRLFSTLNSNKISKARTRPTILSKVIHDLVFFTSFDGLKDFTDFILKLLSLNPISWFPMHLMIEYSDRAHLSQILSEDLLEAQWFGIYTALIFAIFLQTRLYLTRKKRKSLRL